MTSNLDPQRVVELSYATSEGIPGPTIARIVVWAVTLASAAAVLALLINSVAWITFQGLGTTAIYVLYNWVPALLGNLPVLIVGIISLVRGRVAPALVVVLWIEVVVRMLGSFVVVGVYVATQGLSMFSQGGAGRYSVISSIGGIVSTISWLAFPLLAIWILRRPEVRASA